MTWQFIGLFPVQLYIYLYGVLGPCASFKISVCAVVKFCMHGLNARFCDLNSAWKDAQSQVDVETLQRNDATRFKEAGLGAVPKTFPYDPTKVKKVVAAKAK